MDDKVTKSGKITHDSEKKYKLPKWIENKKFENTLKTQQGTIKH